MKLWDELKRRRVFRVAGAYVIVAWLLVQVADIFFPALNLPPWSVTLVAGLVIIGFPIALLLAWAYEITPEGIARSSDVPASGVSQSPAGNKLNYLILGLLVLVVALLIIDRFVLDGDRGKGVVAGPAMGEAEGTFAGVVPLPDSAPLALGIAKIGFDGPLLALSPDGQWLAYIGRTAEGSQVMLRNNRSFDPALAIPGTEGAIHAFFSPDGESIGFITDDRLSRVSMDGREVHAIAAIPEPVAGIWQEEDRIFVIHSQGADLSEVRVSTGEARVAVSNWSDRFSDVLPGGRYALAAYTRVSVDGDQSELRIYDLQQETYKPLGIFGFDARWLPTGHLIFGRNGNLQIVGFDRDKLEIVGKPRPVVPGVAMNSFFLRSQVSVSARGDLAFVPGPDLGVGRIVSIDRQNNRTVLTRQAAKFGVVDLSADDRRLAVHIGDVQDYIWMFDLERMEGRKVPGSDGFGWPAFSRTGDVAFVSVDQESGTTVKMIFDDGARSEQTLRLEGTRAFPSDWSPLGDSILMNIPTGRFAIGMVPLDEEQDLAMIESQPDDWGGVYSPDGEWMAFSTNRTGRYEVWIRRLDGTGTPQQLSVNGGIEPVWCPCGEIFFRRGDQVWSSDVDLEREPRIGAETLAFTLEDFLDTPDRSYDVSSDGQLAYTVVYSQPPIDDQIHVLTNWLQSLEAAGDRSVAEAD